MLLHYDIRNLSICNVFLISSFFTTNKRKKSNSFFLLIEYIASDCRANLSSGRLDVYLRT